MAKVDNVGIEQPKMEDIKQEADRMRELFRDVDPAKTDLVDGLIEEAAFLRMHTAKLKELISVSGMLIIHPTNPVLQKPTEAARQYLKNVNSYAVVIKTLNGVMNKSMIEPDDGLDEFE